MLREPGPSPGGLPRNPACGRLGAPGSPAIYAACAAGFAWIQSWQAAQTMSVLRRILAMRTAHAGCPGSGSPSGLRPVTWWTVTVVPVPQSSHSRLRSLEISSRNFAVSRGSPSAPPSTPRRGYRFPWGRGRLPGEVPLLALFPGSPLPNPPCGRVGRQRGTGMALF